MADTVRTLSALQTLLADNTSGDISPQDIRDFLVSVFPTVIIKASDESVTSSTTQQDDDELTVAVTASSSWALMAFLITDGDTGGDLKAGFSSPTGSSGVAALFGNSISGTTFSDTRTDNQSASLATAGFHGTVGAGNENMCILIGSVTIGGTAGNVAVSWAQRVSSGTATKVKAGSFLVAFRTA